MRLEDHQWVRGKDYRCEHCGDPPSLCVAHFQPNFRYTNSTDAGYYIRLVLFMLPNGLWEMCAGLFKGGIEHHNLKTWVHLGKLVEEDARRFKEQLLRGNEAVWVEAKYRSA